MLLIVRCYSGGRTMGLESRQSSGLARLGTLWGRRRTENDDWVTAESIRLGLRQGAFRMHYQPVVDAEHQRVVAIEALLRWWIPSGVRAAREFVGVAADTGLLSELDDALVGNACDFTRELQRSGLERLRLAINVTANDLRPGNGLFGRIRDAIDAADLMPHWVQVEVQERDLLGRTDEVARTFSALSTLGVSVTVDDFEAREGSRLVLGLPAVRAVKIDLWHAAGDPEAEDRTRAAARAARNAGLAIGAKRLESPASIQLAEHLGADTLQGFAFGTPMRPIELLRYLTELGYGHPLPRSTAVGM